MLNANIVLITAVADCIPKKSFSFAEDSVEYRIVSSGPGAASAAFGTVLVMSSG
jgi:hypothetical protein